MAKLTSQLVSVLQILNSTIKIFKNLFNKSRLMKFTSLSMTSTRNP